LPDTDYIPTWYLERKDGQQGAAEQSAAQKTIAHANTPTLSHFDSMGRAFLTVTDNGEDGKYSTHINLDIEGNQREVIDALDRIVMIYEYNMLRSIIHQTSMDAGERWILNDITGKIIYQWNSRGYMTRTTYDRLRRPNQIFISENNGSGEKLIEKTIYGEIKGCTLNHRGKIFQHFDSSGIVTNEAYDFKGNAIRSSRQFVTDYKTTIDWSLQTIQLDAQIFSTSATYDALDRTIRTTMPDKSTLIFIYNESGLLEKIVGNLSGENVDTTFINGIDYNAKGQREFIEYGNGIKTYYEYDRLTSKLKHMQSLRLTELLQDLYYTYDPVGNIIHVNDNAQQDVLVKGRWVEPSVDYVYDAVYRLKVAVGREHLGNSNGSANPPQPTSYTDEPRVHLNMNDPHMLGIYQEEYVYDFVGNIQSIDHIGMDPSNPGWTRSYNYNNDSLIETGKKSNRLSSTTVGNTIYYYGHDAHGNMIIMPHLDHRDPTKPNLYWDPKDQLERVDLDGGGTCYYIYDASGQRVRKIHEHNGALIEERMYLGNFEIYRKRRGAGFPLVLERQTLRVMNDQQCVALIETRTRGNDDSEARLIRYQLGNHLHSVNLELDDQAKIISYEEYYPYGSTCYQATRSRIETPKRYRFAEKERDEESGLYYYDARYYASWVGRWVSADKIGIKDGPNLYLFVRANPILITDPTGYYGEGGHFYTTYFVSLAAGFDRDTAFRNAVFAQMPDEINSLDAIQQQLGFLGTLLTGPHSIVKFQEGQRNLMQRGLHSLTGGSSEGERSVTRNALKQVTPGTMEFGFLLHRFGDTYAHSNFDDETKMYSTGSGHLIHGHAPDQIHMRPDLYKAYVGDLFVTLSEIASARGLSMRLSRKEVMQFADEIANIRVMRTVLNEFGESQELDVEATESAQIKRIRELSEYYMPKTEFQEYAIGPPAREQPPIGQMRGYQPEKEGPMEWNVYKLKSYTKEDFGFLHEIGAGDVFNAVHSAARRVGQDVDIHIK
jgi:RHS repeat-associated protein